MEIKTDSRDTPSSSEESDSSSESESESESESKSEEERKPRIDTDEHHKLTEDEKQWESAGHFQPKKLNITLMANFQQARRDDGGFKPAPKKTQEISHEMPKAAPRESPREEVSEPSEPQMDVIEVEEIRYVFSVWYLIFQKEPSLQNTFANLPSIFNWANQDQEKISNFVKEN